MTESEHSHLDDPQQVNSEAAITQTGCWSFYLLTLVAGIFLVFVLPSSYALLLLIGLISIAGALSARDSDFSPHDILRTLRYLISGRHISRWQTAEFIVRHRTEMIRSGVLLTSLLMSLSALRFRPGSSESDLIIAVLWLLLGVFALGIAFIAYCQPEPLIILSQTPITPDRSHGIMTLSGIWVLVLFAEINGQLLNLPFLRDVSLDVQFLLLCAGVLLLVCGFSGAPHFRLSMVRVVNWRPTMPIVCLFVLALGLRSWHLETTVYGLIDEALAINHIFAVESGLTPGLAEPLSRFATTPLYSYLEGRFVSWVGHNLAGLRATSALMGALNVVALYLLAKALFDRKTAYIAALLLATFPPHIHFSRIALANIADPLFGTLALAFLARGLQHNRRFDWAVAGASLGFTQYFFEGGRLFFPLLATIWVFALVGIFSPKRMRILWRGLVVMSLTVVFTGMPVYYTIFARNVPRAIRLEISGLDRVYWQQFYKDELSSSKVDELLHRVTFPFRVYVHQPEIGNFYGGQHAMILEYLVPVFLLGVAYAFWRGKSQAFLILLWLIAAPLGNSLLRNSAVYARYTVVFPAVVLTMSLALRYVPAMLWRSKYQLWATMSILILTGVIGVSQVSYYFRTHVIILEQQLRNAKPYRDGFDAVMRSVDLPNNTDIYVISNPVNDGNVLRGLLGFLRPAQDNLAVTALFTDELTVEFLSQLPSAKNFAFFVEPNDETTVRLLQQFFELGEPLESSRTISPEKEYVLYFVPRTEFEP